MRSTTIRNGSASELRTRDAEPIKLHAMYRLSSLRVLNGGFDFYYFDPSGWWGRVFAAAYAICPSALFSSFFSSSHPSIPPLTGEVEVRFPLCTHQYVCGNGKNANLEQIYIVLLRQLQHSTVKSISMRCVMGMLPGDDEISPLDLIDAFL